MKAIVVENWMYLLLSIVHKILLQVYHFYCELKGLDRLFVQVCIHQWECVR